MAEPVPAGFRLAFDPSVRRPRPEVVVGGSPVRVLRLTPAGTRHVDGWARGEPVGAGRAAGTLARRLLDAGIAHPRPPAGAGPPTSAVTVVIPVRDRPVGLAATLASLGPDLAVIVVDDGSVTPVATRRAEVIRHPTSRGPAAARNTGWHTARSDVIAFVDADCQPERLWLGHLLPHLADPSVGAVAPRVVSAPVAGTPAWLAAYERHRSSLDLGGGEAPVQPGSRVPYVPTAALVTRRRALEDVCGFDEALHYGEDVDLVWRWGEKDWRVRYEPAATATHPARPDTAAWLRQRHQYGRSAAPLAARHGRAVAPAALSPWSAAAWTLAAAGYPWAGAGLAAATSALLARQAGRDWATARTLAWLGVAGNLRAGAAIATAIRRAWLPPALVLAGVARRPGVLAAAVTVPPLVEWARARPAGVGVLPWSMARLADDLAYQSGVWTGVVETRSAAALLPTRGFARRP